MSEQSKQDVVVELVKQGNLSREEIRKQADCTSGAFATYLSGMRNAAKFTGAEICPVEKVIEVDGEEKKVMCVVTFDAYNDMKAEAAAKSKPKASKKTPEQRLAEAEKRIAKCEKADKAATGRFDEDSENEELDLRAQKANIELQLAQLELDRATSAMDTVEATEVEASDEDLM